MTDWTNLNVIVPYPSLYWRSIASNALGDKLVACGSIYSNAGGYNLNLGIYYSNNGGSTWSKSNTPINLYWSSIASNESGDKMVACAEGGGIYLSTDGGINWTPSPSAPNLEWTSVAMNGLGDKILACSSIQPLGGELWYSMDGGSNWEQSLSAPDLPWTSVALSTKMLACAEGGGIYFSIDEGVTWEASQGLPPDLNWRSVASNASGTKMVACAAANENGGGIYFSIDEGVTWEPSQNAPTNLYWNRVASNDLGTKMVACAKGGGIYLSTDNGANWSEAQDGLLQDWTCVASNGSGTKILACVNSGGIYSSTDDSNFTPFELNLPINNWTSVASNASGTKMVACVENGGIWYSNNGVWSQLSDAPNLNWISVASNASGTTMVACASGGGIYFSIDSGATWQQSLSATPDLNWLSVASNGSGDKMVACAYEGIYYSINGGETWEASQGLPPDLDWRSVASNSLGDKMAACASGGGIYLSTDGGANWQQSQNAPTDLSWRGVAINASGTKMVACDYPNENGGGIYLSKDSGLTWNPLPNAPILYLSYVAINSVGDKIVACHTNGGGIWYSNDDGLTWTESGPPNLNWNGLAASGLQFVAVALGGGIYLGNTVIPTPISWYSLTISLQNGNTIFNGYFSVDNTTNLVTEFYNATQPQTNILIPTGTGTLQGLNNYGLNYYELSNGIQYDNGYVSIYGNLTFDNYGIIINNIPGYSGYSGYSISLNNVNPPQSTNISLFSLETPPPNNYSLYGFTNDAVTVLDDNLLIDFQSIPEPPPPPSNICFPANTPVTTDQGSIAIDKIDPRIHTINQKPIVDITKTVTEDAFLVEFKKNALGLNYPSENTIISQNHKLCYQGKMVKAKTFLGDFDFENVRKVPYKGEILYNVLLEDHSVMSINNLICETLHPDNIIAKLYTKKCKYSKEKRDKIIMVLNEIKSSRIRRNK